MDFYVVLGTILIWFIYGILIKLTRKRKYDFSLVIAFVFLLGFVYFYYYNKLETDLYTLYTYATLLVFAFWVIIDNTLLLFKKNVSEFDFHDLEEEIEHIKDSSELLRLRFISTIEILNDGISFREKEMIFGTDRYIELLGIDSNEFTVASFEERMHTDDLVQYKMKLEKLSKKYPIYSIKYRIKKDDSFLWVIEQGKLIYINKNRSYISIIKPMDLKLYPETDIDVLNNLEGSKIMQQEMQKMSRTKKSYHLVLIQLTNIPVINEKFGRDFGDLMMGEFLSKLRFKFIKDNKSLFRISGIKFGILIKDKSKFELLDRALVGTGELLNMAMQFGGVSQTIFPNIGISESPYEGKNPDLVMKEAENALELTLRDNYDLSYSFHYKK